MLYKMLQFTPDSRITVEQALAHPYLKDFHGQMEEPSCHVPFDFDFERGDRLSISSLGSEEASRQEVRNSIFEEVQLFRPEAAAAVAVSGGGGQGPSEGKYGDYKGGDFKGGDSKGGDNMDI